MTNFDRGEPGVPRALNVTPDVSNLLDADDATRVRLWLAMTIEEQVKLPPQVRAACIKSANKLGPDTQASADRAARAQEKKDKARAAARPTLIEQGFWIRDAKVTTVLPYVLKGIFGKHQIIGFWGAPGSGKSFITIEMLCAVGSGNPWRGRRTRRGIAVYVVAESARVYIENRIAALRQECEELSQADVLVIPLSLDLLHAPHGDVDRVIETAKLLGEHEGEVLVIAIDTLSATFAGGDENKSEDMGRYVTNIKRITAETAAAVIIIHHCGKNEAAGMRGHTALLGALDAELTIEGDATGPRILRTGKVRDGESDKDLFAFTLRPVHLGVDPDGDDVVTCVVDSTDAAGTQRARQKKQGSKLGSNQKAVLLAVEASGGRLPRVELGKQLRDAGITRNRAHEAVASLLHSGMLVAHNGPVPEVSVP